MQRRKYSSSSSSSEDDCWDHVIEAQLSFEQELRVVETAPPQRRFRPATETKEYNPGNVKGTFKIVFNAAFTKATLSLKIENLKENNPATAAHLHIGTAAVNGDVLVTLFSQSKSYKSRINARGIIRNKNIVGFLPTDPHSLTQVQVNSIASLYQAVKNGFVYVNVHSKKNPEGLIRGQLGL